MKRLKELFKIRLILSTAILLNCPGVYATAVNELALATFGGGCFWCMEPPFEKQAGVVNVEPGYTGGTEANANYKSVSTGKTYHVEVVQVTYDPKLVNYDTLLNIYWDNVDPTDAGGQFVDRGKHYSPVIYYHDKSQYESAKKSKEALGKSKRFAGDIVVQIRPYKKFFLAEEYHRDYYKKNPRRYARYAKGSGRKDFIKKYAIKNKVQGKKMSQLKKDYVKPSDEELKKKLSSLEYEITQKNGTERRPFASKYWDHKEEGIYVDVTTVQPLFSSTDKYDSGTGWHLLLLSQLMLKE